MKSKTPTADAVSITIELSKNQRRLFEVAAAEQGATPGQFILAMACEQINQSRPSYSADDELAALLWKYVAGRKLPQADAWLSAEAIEKLVATAGYQPLVPEAV